MDGEVEIDRLVELARGGDQGAFAALVRRTERLVTSAVGRLLGNPHETEEVVQEVYVDAYRLLPEWRAGARFTTWLYRAATRAALERRRSTGRYERRLDAVREAAGRAGAESKSPAAGLEDLDLARTVREAIEDLPEGQRTTFVLRHYHDLPLAEIAEVRGVALGTVKAQLSQAVSNLRRTLRGVKP